MNTIDIIIFIPLIWAAYSGFKKGFIIEVATLIALAVGIYAGVHFSNYAAEYLGNHIESKLLPLASFGATFIVVVILIFSAGKLLEKVVNMVALKLVNKVLGAIFGMLKAFVIMSVLLLIFESLNQQFHLVSEKTTQDSMLYDQTVSLIQKILPSMKQYNVTRVI